MTQTWNEYWKTQLGQVEQGLAQWRRDGFATVQLYKLRSQSTRKDLYTCVTVSVHGVIAGGGQRHRLALSQVVAPLLHEGECVKLCIRGEDTHDDHLEFFSV